MVIPLTADTPLMLPIVFSTAALACSRSGSVNTRFGGFFRRDFGLGFGIGDGLLARRRQLRRTLTHAALCRSSRRGRDRALGLQRGTQGGSPGTYISAEEFKTYLKVPSVDQQVRSVDIGKTNLQVAISYRGKLDKPASVAEHALVTEVYYVISGSGTNVTGPELVGSVPRPANNNAVARLNGPGHNATAIRNGATQQLKAGDVLVIPAGTGHQFTRIDDHISYVMIRVDPDKVVPLMNEADSKAYLAARR